MVWIGAMICVPALMIGGMIGAGLSLGTAALAIIIGYVLICIFMSFMGMHACDTGLPTAVMAGSALGEKGAKYIISTILAISCIGWFGIQAAVCGSSFSSMIVGMTGLNIPVWLSSVVWGIIMLLTACFRFSGLKWLNKIAVPLLGVVLAYSLIYNLASGNGAALVGYQPAAPIGLVGGISLTVGSFVVAAAISGDYCRFAKSRNDVVKSSILGVLPAGLVVLMLGGILAICTGSYDISVFLSTAGLPFIGLVALVLATWTTNVSNAYSGGLALSVLLGQDEKKSQMTTAVAGIIGTVLAIWLYNNFCNWLTILNATLPAVGVILVADYFLDRKKYAKDAAEPKGVNWAAIIGVVAGAIVGNLTGGNIIPGFSWGIAAVNNMVVSFACYFIGRLIKK